MHTSLTVILRYLFPGRSPDFSLGTVQRFVSGVYDSDLRQTLRRALESKNTFRLYLIQCGEDEWSYDSPKQMADKFEGVIGAYFEESGFDGVVGWLMKAFASIIYAAAEKRKRSLKRYDFGCLLYFGVGRFTMRSL